jgi:hypothetical protein
VAQQHPGEGTMAVMASRAFPRHDDSLGHAPEDGEDVRRLGTGDAAENRDAHGGDGLPKV